MRHIISVIYRLTLFAVTMVTATATLAQSRPRHATVGFWNVENMFDTIVSPLYHDDDDYAPAARQRWDTQRYSNKCANIAQIIDEMSLDVVGIAEIENEAVVRDLVRRLKTDYNYIHRPAGDRPRGRDIALLYKGDRFLPSEVRTVDSHTARSFLYVRGELAGQRVDVVVCHMPSMLNRTEYRQRAMQRLFAFADSLHVADPEARMIVMGDFNATPRDRVVRTARATELERKDPWRDDARAKPAEREEEPCQEPLFCCLESAAAQGRGTYGHNGRWMMYDNIFLSFRLLPNYKSADIYIKPHLLYNDPGLKRHGYPRRTFTNGRYTNGYSDHLPVYCVFEYK